MFFDYDEDLQLHVNQKHNNITKEPRQQVQTITPKFRVVVEEMTEEDLPGARKLNNMHENAVGIVSKKKM